MIWFLSFLLNALLSFIKKLLGSINKFIFHNTFTLIVVNFWVYQSFYSLNFVLVDEFSNRIIFLFRHMNIACTELDVYSSKLGWSYSSPASVSTLEDNMRYSLLGECSRGSNTWNSCSYDDDLMDLLHLRYYDMQVCVIDLAHYKL